MYNLRALFLSLCFLFAYDCCTAPILAAELSTVQETVAYDNADDAAKAALASCMTTEADNEFAGVIIQINGKYFYTSAVSSGEFATFNIHAAFPKSAKLVAIYHTHPGDEYAGEYFSPNDVKVASDLNLVSYIGVVTSHNIHRFVPGHSTTTAYYNGSRIASGRSSSGEVI